MNQNRINILAGSAMGALGLFAIWRYGVAPIACPVPKGLLSQDGTAPCFEFWIARYQTIIAAFVAIVGVYYAVRPVLRQVSLMEMQYAAQFRERLEEKYKMLTELQRILDHRAWSEANPIANPSTDPEEFKAWCGTDPEDQRKRLIEGFEDIARRTELVIGELQSRPFVGEEKVVVDAAIERMRTTINKARPWVMGEKSIETEWEDGKRNVISLWFHAIDQPNGIIGNLMRFLSNDLERIKSGVVAIIVKGPER